VAATINTIHDNLVAALKAADGTGVYTHDLSDQAGGQVRVKKSRIPRPPHTPYVAVVLEEVEGGQDPELGVWRRDLVFTIVGWAPAMGEDQDTRQEAANNMANDILRAVEADRQLGGTVMDVMLSIKPFVARAEGGGSSNPVAVARLECYYPSLTGV